MQTLQKPHLRILRGLLHGPLDPCRSVAAGLVNRDAIVRQCKRRRILQRRQSFKRRPCQWPQVAFHKNQSDSHL